jgi:hypothetical protein
VLRITAQETDKITEQVKVRPMWMLTKMVYVIVMRTGIHPYQEVREVDTENAISRGKDNKIARDKGVAGTLKMPIIMAYATGVNLLPQNQNRLSFKFPITQVFLGNRDRKSK